MGKIKPTRMNVMLRRAVKNLPKLTPEQRAKALIASGAVSPDRFDEIVQKLAAAGPIKLPTKLK